MNKIEENNNPVNSVTCTGCTYLSEEEDFCIYSLDLLEDLDYCRY